LKTKKNLVTYVVELIPQSLQTLAQVTFSELRLVSHAGKVNEVVCAYISSRSAGGASIRPLT